MTKPDECMSDMETSMFDYWLDQYEQIIGEPAPWEVVQVFSHLCRLDDDEQEEAIGTE